MRVITVKPGYVKTKMTDSLKLPRLLTTNPKTVAKYIYKAYVTKKDIIYVTFIWKYIIIIIQLLPEIIFKKLKF